MPKRIVPVCRVRARWTARRASSTAASTCSAWGRSVSATVVATTPLPTRRKTADDDDTGPLADLTRNPDAAVGKPVTFECLTSCEVFDRGREAYELAIETAGGRTVSAVTVNVPKDLALQLADLGVYTPGLPVQAAFNLPNLVAKGDGFGADTDRFSEALRTGLAVRGITLRPNASENSGLHGAIWRQGPAGWRWDSGADDRREGVARTGD